MGSRGRRYGARATTGIALFAVCLATGACPAATRNAVCVAGGGSSASDGLAPAVIDPCSVETEAPAGVGANLAESAGDRMPGCPLILGRMPVNTWIARSPQRLAIRFVPRRREFAHCLSIEALDLLSNHGELIAGRRRDGGLLGPITLDGGGGAVPSKLDTEAVGFGIGIGLSFSFVQEQQ